MSDFFATKSGVTIYATLDIPLLRIPPNVFVSRITCIYSSCVSFNENWPLLATLAPLTCRPFWERFGATIYSTLDVPSLRIPPNFIVSRYTCFYSSCVSFNENWPLLTTLAPLTCPFCERFLRDKKVASQSMQRLTFLRSKYRQSILLVGIHAFTAPVLVSMRTDHS